MTKVAAQIMLAASGLAILFIGFCSSDGWAILTGDIFLLFAAI